jgi:hypothetical protein
MISYISADQKTSTARNDLRKKVSLLILRTVMLLKWCYRMASLDFLPIDSDKVVYAI